MSRRTLSIKWYLVGACLCTCLFLVGCTTNSVNPQAIPTCNSPVDGDNPYFTSSLTGASEIYREFYAHYGGSDSSFYREYAKQKAFVLLGRHTEHWSDFVDAPVDDVQKVRIAITYIHPVLIQHILLINALSNNYAKDIGAFEGEIREVVQDIADRNQLLFGVTITAANNNYQSPTTDILKVGLPIWQMKLVNSKGMYVSPVHVDPILTEQIPITSGPVFGLVGYPVSVLYQGGDCEPAIDSLTATLVLEVPNVTVGANQLSTTFWSIPYRSSIFQDETLSILAVSDPAYVHDSNFNMLRVSQAATPPAFFGHPNASMDSANPKEYWEDMGRYLWYIFIQGIYP